MLLPPKAAAGVADGTVTLAFRRWQRADVRVGSRFRTSAGVVEVTSVDVVDPAAELGRERDPFKIDVRKLKNLGLTLSLETGYRLSPRGRAYLAATARAHPDASG